MALRRLPGNIQPVVSLSEMKRHLIVSHDDDGGLIAGYTVAATQLLETHTERQFSPATWVYSLSNFSECMMIPVCPVMSVDAIRYWDTSGVQQELDAEDFLVIAGEPTRIQRTAGFAWPAVARRGDAVEIEFTAGYSHVPEMAKQAIKLLVGHWYSNREAVGNVGGEVAMAYDSIKWALRWTV